MYWRRIWLTESINRGDVNISVYTPLSGGKYVELPGELKNSMKGLINTKNNDNKCFLWYHIRLLNSLKRHPERIANADINYVNDLDYKGIKLSVCKKDFSKIDQKNNILQ